MLDSNTALFVVMGDPVSHSLSPVMHNQAFQAVGYNGVYLAIRVKDIAAAVSGIKSFGVKGASITIPHKVSVMEVLDELDDDDNPASMLILDSADHITPTEKTLNRRDRETAAYWDAKSIAEEREIPIWTTTHAPKDVVNKIATSENVGESYDKARIADLVFTMNQTKAQRVKGEMRGYLAKYRQGRGGFFVYLQADLARMHFQEKPPEEDEEEDEDDDE